MYRDILLSKEEIMKSGSKECTKFIKTLRQKALCRLLPKKSILNYKSLIYILLFFSYSSLISESSVSFDCDENKPRISDGFNALTKHAAIIKKPPYISFKPNFSPSMTPPKAAAHNGSVAKRTDASDDGTFPSATFSMKKFAEVDIIPVHATAPATVLMDGSKNIFGRVKDSHPGIVPIQPSEKHQIMDKNAVVATTTAVMGSD
mmetsp:Transcript_18463/g.17786  ORF Transcript_18463/g.17786 Transcript_18463/m.17786 type:complete len:204 (+) Transcript_18463:722-1333(+)